MGTKLSPRDNELYQRVDEVLHYIWDPIGVADQPYARDEYHMYLPAVFSMVRSGKSKEEIAGTLLEIEETRMGTKGDKARILQVADLLLEHKEKIFEDPRSAPRK